MTAFPLIAALGARDGSPVPPNRIVLLEAIAESGSLSQAAKVAGLSYRAAWTALDQLNTLGDTPLVITAVGGKGGGGAQLTQAGRNLITVYRAIEAMQQKLLQELQAGGEAAVSLETVRRMMLKTSARNQLHGTVETIRPGTVNDEIVLRLAGGEMLTAVITRESTELLELAPGSPAVALIKASWVRVVPGHGDGQTPGSNRLPGSIAGLLPGEKATEVRVQLPGGGVIVAVVDDATPFAADQPVTAVVDAASIIIGVPH